MKKRVLITGGCGFISHHIIDLFLKKTDWEIVTLDRLDFSGNLNRLHSVVSQYPLDVQKRVKVVYHDLKAEITELTSNFIGPVDIILHLAAASHVDRSITHPMEFVLDNTVGTVNILNYARTLSNLERFIYFSTDEIFGVAPPGVLYKERDRYNSTNPYSASKAAAEEFCVAYENTYKLPIYITHCHDDQTRAWTEDGMKDVSDIKLGDLVWVLKDNKEMALEPVLEIVNNPYEGDMISFTSSKYDLRVTPNHRMLTRHRDESDFRIVTAQEMFDDTQRNHIPTSGEWRGPHADTINIGPFVSDKNHFNSKKVPLVWDANEFLDLVGWYISEGFCRTDGSGEVSISQKKHSLGHLQEGCLGFIPSVREDGVQKFTKHSVILSDFLSEQFGASSYEKRIPSWIKKFSKTNLQTLFGALMKGDGSKTDRYMRYYTVSKRLAEDVAEIGVKLGYSVSIKTRDTFNPSKTKESTSYYVAFRKPVGGVESHNKTKTSYKGNIWCLRTPSGNFFVERNGVVSCSGNTMNVFGERQHPEKFIPKVIRKVRDNELITIHADPTKTIPGSRFYIHARDVAEAMLFLLTLDEEHKQIVRQPDFGWAKCPKFNVVGKEEIDNLTMVKYIAEAQGKEPIYELQDFHTSRPGHDLRYSLDGSFMRRLGWEPRISLKERIKEVTDWSLANPEWIEATE